MKVVIHQVDMDTALTALICGASAADEIIVTRGEAGPEYLANPQIVCIEVGGSGEVDKNNFDHHDPNLNLPPACVQAFEVKGGADELKRLIDYVAAIDVDPTVLPKFSGEITLSYIFSGMRLLVKKPRKQLIEGIKIFKKVLLMRLDPFGVMPEEPEWEEYIKVKKSQKEGIEKAKKDAIIFTSKKGLKIGYLETNFIGAPGALYQLGCHIAIAYNPNFGNPPRPKFTISGNKVRISLLLPILNKLEPGWGGPSHGTIIGSPREGTRLRPDEIIRIVKNGL